MNDFDDLDDVFGPLRGAATDAELAAECSHVDAMARQHRRQKGHTMFSSRRARVATFVAAGVLGFGGIAAAGPGGPSSRSGGGRPTTTTEVTTTTSEAPTTTSEVTTTTSVKQDTDALIPQSFSEELSDDSAKLVDDPDTDFDERQCLEGNHGKTVSAVARGDEGFDDVEQRVVAQSSCGKEAKGLDDDDEDEFEKADADEVDDDDHDDDDHDDDDDDDDDDERSEKSERSGKSESSGKQGNGSKKHSDDD